MTELDFEKFENRISQGDIYKNVYCFENVSLSNNEMKIKRVLFPYVIVLTQDCDMQQHDVYVGDKSGQLFSVLVAPMYNIAKFIEGKHLKNLELSAPNYISSAKRGKLLNCVNQYVTNEAILITKNQLARYHCLDFIPNDDIPSGILDFKHYFSVGVDYLKFDKKNDFVGRLKPLYRELLTQRFSNYLCRIGLPNNIEDENHE